MKAKQLPFIESPTTVPLIPVYFGDGVGYFRSPDNVLVLGIKVKLDDGQHGLIGHLPRPIPRSWAGHEIWAVIEYVTEGMVDFTVHYVCNRGRTQSSTGKLEGTGEKERAVIDLDEQYIEPNQLFSATLDVESIDTPVLIMGFWLEVGIEK